jgi:deazaflavin-dependent oxidoreductase (nitroreductase family)
MPAVRRNALTEWLWNLHTTLYRWTGGKIGGKVPGFPVLLLTTTGRKTGTPRTSALTYVPDGDACVVVASNAGEPRHPAWWLNLTANPRGRVQRFGEVVDVVAREADGAERERLYQEFVRREPGYATYVQRTTRRIPVVVLEPVRGS